MSSYRVLCLVAIIVSINIGCAPTVPGAATKGGFGNPFKASSMGPLQKKQQSRQDFNRQMVLGNKYYTSGQFAEAYTTYRDVAALDPRNALVQYRLGNIAFRQKNHAQAVKYFDQTLQLTPNNPKAHYNMAISLLELAKKHLSEFQLGIPGNTPNPKVEQLIQDLERFYSHSREATRPSSNKTVKKPLAKSSQSSRRSTTLVTPAIVSPPLTITPPAKSPARVPKRSTPKANSDMLDSLADELGI